MATSNHVGNPFEYFIDRLSSSLAGLFRPHDETLRARARIEPQVRRIGAADLRDALRAGLSDFAAARDDVLFIAVVYPVAGLLLAVFALQHELLPMIFPLVSGFALLGPLAAVGLLEISRRRERGETVNWADAAKVLNSPALGAVALMGLVLIGLFLLWLVTAYQISLMAFGGQAPETVEGFIQEVFAAGRGGTMLLTGAVIGFGFAVVALAVSVVAFPLLLDRQTTVGVAIRTSLRVVAANPGTMALWGLIVAAALVIGSLPALVGLIVVMPVLGHATWHLYRKAVA